MSAGIAALGWAARLLVTNPLVLTVAGVAAVCRVVHFGVGEDRLGTGGVMALETVTGISRLALVLAVLWVAQRRAGLSEAQAEAAFSAAWTYLRHHWGQVLVAGATVGLAAGAANLLLWGTARGLTDGAQDTATMLAVVYGVKNLTIIPVFMVALLHVLRLIPTAGGGR